jgi:hypothetical protein
MVRRWRLIGYFPILYNPVNANVASRLTSLVVCVARRPCGSDCSHLCVQASLGGRKHAALLLVSRGAEVDAESAVQERHYTPLVQVALADRVDAMELLLDVGAKPDVELSCGSTALIECAAAGLVRPAQVGQELSRGDAESSRGVTRRALAEWR